MIHWFPQWLSFLQAASEPDEDPRPEATAPEPADFKSPEPDDDGAQEPSLEAPGVLNVGAWCGLAAIRNPERDIAFAAAHNINRLDVIVNDHSTARDPRDFDTYDRDAIVRFCHKAQAAGIQTHLMSWIMPHAGYIEQAAEQLTSLATLAGAASIQWDAEEPWTQGRKRLKYSEAARRIADAFKGLPCPMGVNGIGYTPTKKFGPIAEVCDYLVPQCYSTHSSGQKPEEVVPRFHRRYRKLFGDKRIVMGLAAYRQKNIPGHTVDSAMRTALAGAQAIEGIDTVIYWSLRHIRGNRRVRRVIASIRKPAPIA